jgi:hypothetical protein
MFVLGDETIGIDEVEDRLLNPDEVDDILKISLDDD